LKEATRRAIVISKDVRCTFRSGWHYLFFIATANYFAMLLIVQCVEHTFNNNALWLARGLFAAILRLDFACALLRTRRNPSCLATNIPATTRPFSTETAIWRTHFMKRIGAMPCKRLAACAFFGKTTRKSTSSQKKTPHTGRFKFIAENKNRPLA
jgi:hypothetical protein